jgi:Uma2 family endonuclease
MIAGVAVHRFSVDEYHRMAETDILAPGCRFELLDGEIIDVSPANSRHAAVVSILTGIFGAHADGHYIVRVQSPLQLDDFNEPEPDLAIVLARSDFYCGQHPTASDVLIVIEVADSSLRYDRDVKREAYARAGIHEYWIVDVNGACVHVYRSPSGGHYTSETLHRAGKLSPSLVAAVVISVESLSTEKPSA